MNRADSTSLSLLQRAREQQPDAWARLVDLYAPLVHHWCRQSHLGEEDLADVFQEVFQAVAQHLDRFQRDRDGGTFRGWLRVITRNKINDHFRKQQQEPPGRGGSKAQEWMHLVNDPTAGDESSEINLVEQQLRKALDWIQHEFEERTWKAFWAVQMDNHAPKDIAEVLGMTAAAVRKARYRVLARLREELDGLYP